jgi:hypothetical protein
VKVVAVLGSPRVNGNTTTLTKVFTNTAEELGAEVQTFSLNILDAKGCQGCEACKTTTDHYVINDARAMDTRINLTNEDFKLIEAAKETSDRLHVDDVYEVAAALRTRDKKIFTGIHMDANVGFADARAFNHNF